MSERILISSEERTAIYERILLHLSGIDAVWLAAEAQDFQTAERLGQEYCDELRLLMEGLGWGEGPSEESIELTCPPDVVKRVMRRLRAAVDALDQEEQEARAVVEESEEENRRVRAACDRILTLSEGAE